MTKSATKPKKQSKIDKALQQMTVNEKTKLLNDLRVLSETVVSRASLTAKLGKSFGTKRDLYEACGYPEEDELGWEHYEAKFQRFGLAHRVIKAYPRATWRKPPEVYEDEDPQVITQFEQAWKDIEKKNRIWNYIRRADILAGIGRYSVLLLGINDGNNLSEEIIKGQNRQLLFLQPYAECNASIESYITDRNDERYQLPEFYKIKMRSTDNLNSYYDEKVHWSRVIHIAEDLLEDDVFGVPRLKPDYNRFQDLETIVSGSAEMFWQGAFPGVVFSLDADADADKQDVDSMDTEIKNYIHKLRRFMRLQGVTPHQLLPNIADPNNHVMVQLKLISGTYGIPLRILIGSERGELASTQDDDNWNDRVMERQGDFGEFTLRLFIDRLIFAGVLPEVKEYFIDWPDIHSLKEEDKVKIGKTRAETIATYANSLGAQDVMSLPKFLEKIMYLTPEEIEEEEQAREEMFNNDQEENENEGLEGDEDEEK